MGCGIGISLGQGVAGAVGPRFGWRLPFLIVSVPAMMCAVAVWMCVPEVERGAGEKRSLERTPSNGADYRFEGGVRASENELEMTGRMENAVGGFENESDARSPCTLRKSTQATSRTTLVTGDSPKQGLYVQLDNHGSSGSLSCGTPATTPFWMDTRWLESVQTLKTLLQCPSVLLAIFQGAPGCIPW